MSRQPVCNSVSVCLVVPADVIVYLICTRNLAVLGTTIAVRTFVVRPPGALAEFSYIRGSEHVNVRVQRSTCQSSQAMYESSCRSRSEADWS